MKKSTISITVLSALVVATNVAYYFSNKRNAKINEAIIAKQKDELAVARRERDTYMEVSNNLRKEKEEWKNKYEEVCRNL